MGVAIIQVAMIHPGGLRSPAPVSWRFEKRHSLHRFNLRVIISIASFASATFSSPAAAK